MSRFSYEQYAETVAAAQNKGNKDSVKVGFFKLADGESALVRINVSKIEDLDFATIHKVKRNPDDKFCGMSVSCLNPIGKYDEEDCPLCKAVAAGNTNILKAAKRVYVQMMVALKKADGTFDKPVPMIFERPAGFSRELATKLKDYGDLTKVLFKITRTGSGLDTKYSVDYAVPAVFKPELVPEDFSAFDKFDISKHSYWVKSKEDLEVYVATSAFPENKKETVSAENPTVKEDAAFETPEAVKEEVPTTPAPEKKTGFNGFSF